MEPRWLISSAKETVCLSVCLSVKAVLSPGALCKREAHSIQHRHFSPYPFPNPLRLKPNQKAQTPLLITHFYAERPLLQQRPIISPVLSRKRVTLDSVRGSWVQLVWLDESYSTACRDHCVLTCEQQHHACSRRLNEPFASLILHGRSCI